MINEIHLGTQYIYFVQRVKISIKIAIKPHFMAKNLHKFINTWSISISILHINFETESRGKTILK